MNEKIIKICNNYKDLVLNSDDPEKYLLQLAIDIHNITRDECFDIMQKATSKISCMSINSIRS